MAHLDRAARGWQDAEVNATPSENPADAQGDAWTRMLGPYAAASELAEWADWGATVGDGIEADPKDDAPMASPGP